MLSKSFIMSTKDSKTPQVVKQRSPLYAKAYSKNVIATNIFMGICVVIIVCILALITRGYSLGSGGNIEQSGLLQFKVQPSAANVRIDNKYDLFRQSSTNRLLRPGLHDIKANKDGYDSWRQKVHIEPGLLTDINWIRLFPLKKHLKTLISPLAPPSFVASTPNHRFSIYLEKDSGLLHVFNLESDPVTDKSLALTSILSNSKPDTTNTPPPQNCQVLNWNQKNSAAIMACNYQEQKHFFLLNLEELSSSFNLSLKTPIALQDVQFSNDANQKLWLLSQDSKLLYYDLESQSTKTIATNVQKFSRSDRKLLYQRNKIVDNKTQSYLYFLPHAKAKAIKIQRIHHPKHCLFIMANYWNKDWVYLVDGQKITIFSDLNSSIINLRTQFAKNKSFHISFQPDQIDKNFNNQIITLSHNQEHFAYNLNNSESHYFFSPKDHSSNGWIDDYLRYDIVDQALNVYDFDGNNYRKVLDSKYQILPASTAVISNDSNSLFFFSIDTNGQSQLQKLKLQ